MNKSIIDKAVKVIKKYNNYSASLLQVELKLTLEEATQVIEYIKKHPQTNDPAPIQVPTVTHVISNNMDINIDTMDGHSFEYYCADILRYNGYTKVQVTSGSGDFGVDILCEKDGYSIAIQCKCYSGNVGNKAVQEVVSGKIFYKCDKAIVMTNSYFTPAAYETARLTNAYLWDRGRIKELHRIAVMNGYVPQKY